MHSRLNRSTLSAALLLSSLTLAVVSILSELFSYVSGDHAAFQDLPRANVSDIFFDLKIWTFNLSDCDIPLSSYRPDVSCTSNLYPFAYPVFPLYLLRLLPLDSTSHVKFGIILGLLTVLSLASLFSLSALREKSWKYSIVMATASSIFILSPPFRYLVERGQIDQVILLLLIFPLLLAYAVPRLLPSTLITIIAYVCYGIGALAKIYPIVAYLSNMLFSIASNLQAIFLPQRSSSSRIRHSLSSLSALVVFLFLIALLYQPYLNAKSALFPNLGGHGFGLVNLIDAPYALSMSLNLYSKITLFTASLIVCVRPFFHLATCHRQSLSNNTLSASSHSSAVEKLYLNIVAIMVATYLFSDSINYKLSLIGLLIPYLSSFTLSSSLVVRTISSLLLISGLLSTVLSGYPPYNPVLYTYKEWITQFLLHPIFFGGLMGVLVSRSLRHIQLNTRPLPQSVRH